MIRTLVLLFCLAAAHAVLVPASQGSTLTQTTDFRGDDEIPHFSWTLHHSERAQGQSAYHIKVFGPDSKLVWDSQKTLSSNNVMIPYTGPALAAETVYTWTVQWWDLNGVAAKASSFSSFETGISTWDNSSFISTGMEQGLLRKEFSLDSEVKSAKLFVTGMGFMDMYLNGELVTDYFGNGWTTFRKRLLYTVYDVTKILKKGDNAIGASLSKGWADWDNFPSRTGGDPFGPPSVRAVLRIQMADGSTASVGTDGTWSFDRSPVTDATIYNGETYDARLEQDGWTQPNFKPPFFGNWQPCKVIDAPTALVSRMFHPPIQVLETFKPVQITQPKEGVFVVKFPHNVAGAVRLRVKGTAGTSVVLRHAEILNHTPIANATDGMIYTDNLRSAKATDTYVLRGLPDGEVFSPRNTYHGFQYVEVTGYPGNLTVDDIDQLFVATNVASRSSLEFSNAVLNNLQERAVRGQRANLMSVPTDCPQRDERLGWMGDANLSADSFSLNFDIASFFANFLRLIRDEQRDDGAVPDVVPAARYSSIPGEPAWAGAYPTLAWSNYKYFGDLAVVKEQLKGLKGYIDFLDNQEKQTGLYNYYASYGDWCPPPPAPRASIHYTAAYSYIKSVKQMAEMELALGNKKESDLLLQEVSNLAYEFESVFWNATLKNMDIAVQTDMAIALDIVMPDTEVSTTLAMKLLGDIVDTNKMHMSTGIIGAKVLLPVLAKNLDHADVAFDVASQITYPSWGYMQYDLDEPASAIWELLDAPVEGPGMNSRNHHMFSSVSAFMFSLAGLQILDGPEGAGFAKFKFTPNPMPGLSHAAVSINTPRGLAKLDWTQTGGVQCQRAAEGTDLTLDCGEGGGVIQHIPVASFGLPNGGCAAGFAPDLVCHSQTSEFLVHAACFGKQSCTISATTSVFGDPCYNEFKVLMARAICTNPAKLNVTTIIPPGVSAEVVLPSLGQNLNNLEILESGNPFYSQGNFVSNDAGVLNAKIVKEGVSFELGSGEYSFAVTPTSA